jgi:hypothetical protein
LRVTSSLTPPSWLLLRTQSYKMRRETKSKYAHLLERLSKLYPWLKLREKSHLWMLRVDTWQLLPKTT